jgi:Ni,Fe-hydrogenase I cytochrome b subunit
MSKDLLSKGSRWVPLLNLLFFMHGGFYFSVSFSGKETEKSSINVNIIRILHIRELFIFTYPTFSGSLRLKLYSGFFFRGGGLLKDFFWGRFYTKKNLKKNK